MDAEDTHDGGRNHRPYMDSFGVDKFQSIVEKIFNNSRTLRNIQLPGTHLQDKSLNR